MIAATDTVLVRPLTTESFLAWEDRQEGKYEFDGRNVIQMSGKSFAHQDIVHNLRGLLGCLLSGQPFRVAQEMRLRIGTLDQTIRTVTDAVAIFEVLSDVTWPQLIASKR